MINVMGELLGITSQRFNLRNLVDIRKLQSNFKYNVVHVLVGCAFLHRIW